MNWEAIGSIGETLGALAVLATLVYLSLQVRHGKEQGDKATLHHVADGFRDFTSRIAASDELASIYRRGRTDYYSLSDDERERFNLIYVSLLNLLESWHMQSGDDILTMSEETQVENLRAAILYYCDNPGFREVWQTAKPMFPELTRTMDRVLNETEHQKRDV